MSVPSVNISAQDNQLGVTPPSDGRCLAITGNSTGGTALVNVPVLCSRPADAVAACGAGPLVEHAVWKLATTSRQVLLCRTDFTTTAAIGTIDNTGMKGTAVAVAHSGAAPIDGYEVVVTFTTAGAVGTAGVFQTYSLDGGRTTSQPIALGVTDGLTLPASPGSTIAPGVQFDMIAAATILAGDTFNVRTTAAKWSDAQLATALTALQNTSIHWDGCEVVGALTGGSDVTVIETAANAMRAIGKYPFFVGHFRIPLVGESEATYNAAWTSAFSSSISDNLTVCKYSCYAQSPISQFRYQRSPSIAVASAIIEVRPGVDPAWKALGALPTSIQILDNSGNPALHDELLTPGPLNDRSTCLRSWSGSIGAFINNAYLMSQVGSDFTYIQHLRAFNAVAPTVKGVLEMYLSAGLETDPTTGFIAEHEALSIESAVDTEVETEVVNTGDISAAKFTLNRNDNILSTFALNGAEKIIPLAYPKSITVPIGFYNPALATSPVNTGA